MGVTPPCQQVAWFIVVFFGVTAGAPSVFLRPLTDGASEVVCPNFPLNIECVGTEVSFLEWQRNDMEIEPNFNIGDSPRQQNTGPYTLILEAIDVDQTRRVANMTTRLVVNISSLTSGDEIMCATLGINSSETLNYMLRGPPPAPIIDTDFSITLGEDNSTFNISWNSSFTTVNAITSYIVTPPTSITEGEDLAVICPLSCSPDIPCRCTGLAVGERVTVNISAVNCDTQEGEAVAVTVASSCLPNDLGISVDSKTDSRCNNIMSLTSFGGSVNITNGVGCFNTAVGSVATYMCDEGYTLVPGGDSTRTCFINGSWNGSTPECKDDTSEVSHQSSNQLAVIISVVGVVAVLAVTIIIIIMVLIMIRRRGLCRKQKRYDMKFDPEPDQNYRIKLQRK